jgi:hypothetical protein
MRRTLTAFALSCAGFAFSPVALAALPAPVIEKAFQADPLIYDEQLTKLDANGRFVLNLMGKNLAPDDLAHPANSGYVHLYMRGLDPAGKAGKWIPCGEGGDCKVYGSTSRSGINLGLNPNFYLNTPGTHLQFRLWVSQGPSDKGAPEEAAATTAVSSWSNTYTVDRAAAGVTKAKPVPVPPVIQRVNPAFFEIIPGRQLDWTVLVYGDHLCGGQVDVTLNGAVVARPGGCTGVDVDGSFLPARTSLLKFVLPEAYRRSGDYTLVLRSSDGNSNPIHVTVKAMKLNPLPDRGVAPQPALQTIKPGVVVPPLKPN